MRSLERRLLAAILVVVSAGLALVGLMVLTFVTRSLEQGFDARLRVAATTLAAGADFAADGEFVAGEIPSADAFQRVGSGWYWMISAGDRMLSRSRSLWTNTLAPATEPSDTARSLLGPRGEPLRAVDLRSATGRPRTAIAVTVAAPAGALAEEIGTATTRLALILLGGALATMAATAIAVRRGLHPLSRAAADVVRLGAGELPALAPSGYREIDGLIGAVNRLLDDARETVARSRLLSANLAHGLKTPLAALRTRAALIAPNDRTIAQDVSRLDRQIDRHLRRVVHLVKAPVAMGPTRLCAVIDDVCLVARRSLGGRAVSVTADVATDLSVSADREALEEVFGALVDNAAKWAEARVDIAARATSEAVLVTIDDDGPGMPERDRQAVLRPGTRLDEEQPGQGLGLSIAKDVLEAIGGELRLDESPLGGLRASVRLPTKA